MIFLADAGDSANFSSRSICEQVEGAFLTGDFGGAPCHAKVGSAVRAARGLAVQHEARFAGSVAAMESYLGEEGYAQWDWGGVGGLWQRPYKARFLQALAASLLSGSSAGGAAAAPVRNVCSVGFSSGHSTLLLHTAGTAYAGSAGGPAPSAPLQSLLRVFSFDRATGRASVPVHDFLDDRFPEGTMLFLGDPPAAMGRFQAAFPDSKCQLLLLEPHDLQPLSGNASAQALRSLQQLAAEEHVLVLLSGRLRSAPPAAAAASSAGSSSSRKKGDAAADAPTPGAVWSQAAEAGWLAWEGTLLESPDAAEGDSVLYGSFSPGAAELMKRSKLPVELK